MDLKQNGLQQSNPNNASTPTQERSMIPQKISRRRCRSECLATAPSLGLQIERYNLKHNTEHYAIKSAQQNLRNSYTIKASHQMKDYYNYPNPGNESSGGGKITNNGDTLYRSSGTLRKDNVKENNASNGFERTRNGPEITDLKDIYLQEMDLYRERLNLGTNGYRNASRYQHSFHRYGERNGMIKGDYGYFNPRNSVFDANRRRIRARSESEPHELYTTVINNCAGSSNNTTTSPSDNYPIMMMQNSRSMSSNRGGEDVSVVSRFFLFYFFMSKYSTCLL